MVPRCLLLGFLTATLTWASSKAPLWQTGTFHLEPGASYHSAPPMRPRDQQYLPQYYVTVVADLTSQDKTYRAQIAASVYDDSVPPRQAFPWLTHMPSLVQFRVRHRTLYYLDSSQKEHKAHILVSRQ
jgi:ABC-type transport system substrate-binding protein